MEVESNFDAPRKSEVEMGGSSSPTTTVLNGLNRDVFHTESTSDPFAITSMVKSTEMTNSFSGSMQVIPSKQKKDPDGIIFRRDDVEVDPAEDIDVFKNVSKDQNVGFCDNAFEKCLSTSMIPEDFVEDMLCKADKTLCTCQTTAWMENTTGYSFVEDDETFVLISDDDTKSTDGTISMSMSTVSGSQPDPLANSMLESKERDEEKRFVTESGFECVLQRKLAFEENEDDEPDGSCSPSKLSASTDNNDTNQEVVTPPPEKPIKYLKKFRIGKLSKKMSFKRRVVAEI